MRSGDFVGTVKCIFHEEKTGSLFVIHDVYKCFGCGKNGIVYELSKKDRKALRNTIKNLK